MKFKVISLVGTAIAGTLPLSILGGVFVQPRAIARPAPPPQQLAQAAAEQEPAIVSALNLTPQQQAQFQQIQRLLQAQVRSILTPEQYRQLQTLSQQEGQSGEALNVNLSNEQKTKLQEAVQLANQQLLAILTPAQREQLVKLIQTP